MNSRIIQVVGVALFGGLVALSAALMPSINDGRRALNLMGAAEVQKNAPPEYAFFVQAFGAFRGMLTNYLFIRAETYKQEGRYYDAMQLASWICALQPRFPSVWEFHAWNMAWNISVTTYTPEERWNWVYNGARLIRDQGLRWNPRSVNLYKQLAWIFVNKMSETTDEYHMAYKRNWAWRMHLLLGPPPDPTGLYRPGKPFEPPTGSLTDAELMDALRVSKARRDAERGIAPPVPATPASAPADPRPLDSADITSKAMIDYLNEIGAAPLTRDELFKQAPETRAMLEKLSAQGVRYDDAELTEETYWSSEGLANTFFQKYRALKEDPGLLLSIISTRDGAAPTPRQDPVLKQFDDVVGVTRNDPVGIALVRHLQHRVLREVYKLDPHEMAELIRHFGPMDWRVVDAQSLYWVNRALIESKESVSNFKNDKVNTARLIFFSLRNLFNRNKLTFEPYYADINLSYLNFSPDLNFIEPMHRAYVEYGPMIDPSPEATGAGATFRTGHINFLAESIRMLYFFGRRAEAQYYYDYLQMNYGRQPDGSFNPEYDKTLQDYVMDTFYQTELDWRAARVIIAGLLVQAVSGMAEGNQALYEANMKQAHGFYVAYHDVDSPLGVSEKMQLPPFQDMVLDLLREALLAPATTFDDTLTKARLWYYLPLELRRGVYDDIVATLRTETEKFEFDLARAFPEPEGMKEYREANPRRGPEQKDRPVETPAQQL